MADDLEVRVETYHVLRALSPRPVADYVALLAALDIEDVSGLSDDEIREMCFMSLQDLDGPDAARAVLAHDLGAVLKVGQIDNLAEDMITEKVWEEYPTMTLHERLFVAASLLWAAVPRVFPQPDAVRIRIVVTPRSEEARACLAAPVESFVVRLLAAGMGDDALLHRLFEEAVAGAPFPEADTIVWTVTPAPGQAEDVVLEVTSSSYWLGPLRDASTWTSHARPDGHAEMSPSS